MSDAATVSAAFGRIGAVLTAAGIRLAASPITEPGRAGDTVAGRVAARHALGALGVVVADPLGRHDDGRPVWPAGTTGSIAHAGAVACAAAALVAAGAPPVERAVGVDIEVAGALPAADALVVLDAHEQALVDAHPAPDELATLLWSAKEAAYKAWHTATDGGLVQVDPVEIHIDLSSPDRDTDGGDAADAGDAAAARLRPVRVRATGRLAAMAAEVGPLEGWCVETPGYVAVVVVAAARAAARGPHQGRDGMASAATTNPSAANATT